MAGRSPSPKCCAQICSEAETGLGPAAPTCLFLVCAWCRRIRREDGAWEPLELFLARGTDASFTHGMCPECFEGRAAL